MENLYNLNIRKRPLVTNVSMSAAIEGEFPEWCNSNTVLIQIQDLHNSFSGTTEDFVVVKNKDMFLKTYQFRFNDEETGKYCITDEQAMDIANIIKECYNNGWNLVSHCHAGLCRSGAVTEAAVLYGFNDIDNNPRIPNSLVHTKIRKELGFYYSFEDFKVFDEEVTEVLFKPDKNTK